MEEKGIAFMKTMSDGRVKIFKRYYCCFGLEVWKDCPESYCHAWPCKDKLELCPHYLCSVKPQLEDILDIDLSIRLDK